MKQCPTCERLYTDDSLVYCLLHGDALVPAFNLEATHINTPIPPISMLPTVAANNPTLPMPEPPPKPVHTVRSMSRSVILGALVIGILFGVGITVWMLQKPNVTAANEPPTTPTPIRTEATIKSTPTPKPTPSPLTSPSPKKVESEPECMLYNDKADRSGVITRSECDVKDCESDESTMGMEYPDQTPVRVIKGSSVKGKRFNWVKVLLVEKKLTVWVAASKIKC